MLSLRQLANRIGKIRAEKVSVGLPFGLGSFEITPNRVEQRAAWSLYVELTTRVAVQPFERETGSMLAVLDSLYSVFGLTRQILREAGPDVAQGPQSFGPLAIEILTKGIAPFTSKWNARLRAHEATRPAQSSIVDHERSWEQFHPMLADLEALQKEMRRYTAILAQIAGARMTDKEPAETS